ncbi:ead/Ea22-like family protein [Escherichia coli]|uniref:ead/Ea22-like family protein n=1 Tax=Escherichia coli TaxID=562 RepID=UPI001FCE71CB|nr:ead/Ea22-like family protein [Escherichia coli]
MHAGFDWDSGKVLIFPAQPLTTLTPEQITDITDSVRKGQSWHAYQEYKKHKEQLEKLSIELDTAKQRIAELEGNRAALAAENAGLNKFIAQSCYVFDGEQDEISDAYICATDGGMPQTPATDAFLAEVKTEARKEGAYFVANRMLAAWEAGFIDDTAKNAADIARMILTSTEFMANAPEGDFDRSFSDGVLEDIAAQLGKGGKQ